MQHTDISETPRFTPAKDTGISSPAGPEGSLMCEHVAERLPWLINGSMTTAEERTVTEHLEICDTCSQDLVETIEAASVFWSHVPGKTLVEYSQGMEPQALSRDEVAKHLNSCATCQEDLEMINGPSNVVDFAQARKRRFLGLQSTANRRLALAAAFLLAVLGSWTAFFLPGQPTGQSALMTAESSARDFLRSTELAADTATPMVSSLAFESDEVTAAADAVMLTDFLDGFESGDLSRWSQPNS